jgi:trans-aconitate methyltransferase
VVDDILELASGTGIWTQELLRIGKKITAIDASEEVIAINRSKLNSLSIKYHAADLFTWQPAIPCAAKITRFIFDESLPICSPWWGSIYH